MHVSALSRKLREEISKISGPSEASAIIRLIFHSLKGWDATDLVIHAGDEVSDFTLERIGRILERLRLGEPIQYILGEGRFYGMDLKVTPDVLIPRHETEELIDLIRAKEGDRRDLRVLDVGTGSGAIAIALSRNLLFPEIRAIDISEKALEVAEYNAKKLHADIQFIQEDIFEYTPEPESLDIIVSNPPYVLESEKKDIEPLVLDHEPAIALFVPDSDPIRYYSRIAEVAESALAAGGRLYFEINPPCAEKIKEMLDGKGFSEIEIHHDISRRLRFISAIK